MASLAYSMNTAYSAYLNMVYLENMAYVANSLLQIIDLDKNGTDLNKQNLAYLANFPYLANMAFLANMAYLACLANMAYLANMANLANMVS